MTTRDDVLAVEGVTIPCIIGVYPEERGREQPLVVSLRMPFDARRAGAEDNLALTIDYARLLGEVRFVLKNAAPALLEHAAEVIAKTVLASQDTIDAVEVTLRKPEALVDGVPRLTITRARDTSQSVWTFPFGVVEVLQKTATHALYRLRLRSKGSVRVSQEVTAFSVDADRHGAELGAVRRLKNDDATTHSYVLKASPPLRLDMFQPGDALP